VTDHLRNSPLNRYLYKKLLMLMPIHDIDMPIVSIFNEVYYQCVRVRFDSKPGVDVGKRYFPEVEARFNNCLPAAQLVFCLVWVLYQLKPKLTFNEECFIEQLEPYIHNKPTSLFREEADRLEKELKSIGMIVSDEFSTMTCPIEELCVIKTTMDYRGPIAFKFLLSGLHPSERKFESLADDEAWVEVTNNYSQSVIETLVELYSKPADKLVLLECIYRSCSNSSIETQNRVIPFIVELQDRIAWAKTADTFFRGGLQLDKDNNKDNDLLLGMAREKFLQENPDFEDSVETAEEKVERLERECRRLKQQNEEFKDQYSSEIAELKESLSKYEKQTEEKEQAEPTATAPQELSFTIAEVVEYAKEHFNEPIGKEVSTMLMRLALKHHNYDEDMFLLIDSIEKAIKAQNKLQQMFDFSNVGQLNINPKNVENRYIPGEPKQ
jgi:hypothetical protein